VLDCTSARAFGGTITPPPDWFTHTRVILLSLAGGVLGIAGSFVGELQAGGFLLLVFIGAPIIEEAFKPIGVFLALACWPRALESRLYRALLCAGAGAVFGLVESAVYVWVYAPDHPDWYPAFRFTIPVFLHALASFTVGLGLDWRVVDWVNHGTRLPKRARNFYFAGVTMHSIYNTTAVVLVFAGVFDF
jgi:RsiW-degrading membrane proteinase PrsW (M82 family)